jgi:hypothetical protein
MGRPIKIRSDSETISNIVDQTVFSVGPYKEFYEKEGKTLNFAVP